MVNYSVVIQAGGESTRMGHDKGLLSFGQYKMVEYILNQVREMGEQNFIVSNSPENYTQFGLPVYPDIHKNIGALGGFHTVLSNLETDYALVLACDMPFVQTDLVKYMLSLAFEFDIVIPRLDPDGFAEPFRAVYSKNCLSAVETAIRNHKRRVVSFFQDIRVRYVELNEIRQFDPDCRTFFNVNTPDDLQKAVQMAGLRSL